MDDRKNPSIVKLAIPAFLSQASFTVTGIIDLIMVGTISSPAIAAVGMGGTLFWNIMVLFGGPAIALLYLCGQAYGSRDYELYSKRLNAGLILCLALSIGFSLFPGRIAEFLYTLMGAEEEVIREGVRYFKFRLLGFPIHMLYIALESGIKATGNTKTPMLLKIGSHLCNILGNYLLIFGKLGFPALGTLGAGLASFIADIAALVGFILVFGITAGKKGITLRQLPELKTLVLVLREGIKVSFQQFATSFSILIYTSFIARLGAVALAANQIGVSIISMSFLPAHGLGQASEILISQWIGQGKPLEAKSTGYKVQLYCILLMVAFGLFIGFFPRVIGGLYTRDAAVLLLLIPLLRISALFQVLDALQIVLAASLRAIGDTTYLMILTILGSWLIFIPYVWLVIRVFNQGLLFAWAGRYIFMFFLCAGFSLRYKRVNWAAIKPV